MEQYSTQQPVVETEKTEMPVNAPAARKPLIAPAIFVIINAILSTIAWFLVFQKAQFLAVLTDHQYILFAYIASGILSAAADVVLVLFCLNRKERLPLLGAGCLLHAVSYGVALAMYPVALGILPFIIPSALILMIVETAIFAMLLIDAISAFTNRFYKVIFFITAGLILAEGTFSFVTTDIQASSVLSFVSSILFAVAFLLIAILRKPAKEKGLRRGGTKFSNRHPVLYRTLVALGSTAVPFIIGWAPIILLLAYADRISGVLFAVLLVLYIALLGAAAILVVRPRRMNELRAILGDEAFFARYPHEKKKELRRWQKVDAYRDAGAAEEPEKAQTIAERVQAEEAWRRRRNRTMLIVVCTIILFAAVMIVLYDNRDAITSWTGYVRAEMAESAGNTQEAIDRFSVLGSYKDAAARAAKLARELVGDEAYFKPFREAEVGDVVTFGTYEQDNREDNGKEPIRWIVLAKEGGRELLLSESVLDAQPWRTEAGERNGWKGSWLRKWLNDAFYETAFSETERYLIGKTGLEYSYYRSTGSSRSKRVTATTEDRVFLLDSEEKITYLLDDDSGQKTDCYYVAPTAYALAHGAIPFEDNPYAPEGTCGWWDRSGNGLSGYGVRPAIWILAGE